MELAHRYDRLWERLLLLLEPLGQVDTTDPEGIRLTIDGHDHVLVMTEREWDDLVTTPYGSFSGAARHLLQVLGRAQAEDLRYLVYDMYEIHACATPEKPETAAMEADNARLRAELEDSPDFRGEWRAYRPGKEPR